MTIKKNKKYKMIFVVAIVIVIIAIVTSASFLSRNAAKEQEKIERWGVTFKINPGRSDTTYSTKFHETNDNLQINTYAEVDSPQPGSQIDYIAPKITGNNKAELILQIEGVIKFPDNSFIMDGRFMCPLQFCIGKDKSGKEQIIDGKNYINNRQGLQDAIRKAFDILDIDDVKPGTDMELHMKTFYENHPIYVKTLPENDLSSYQNSKLKIDSTIIVKEK